MKVARRSTPRGLPDSPWSGGWHREARTVVSPNFGSRPGGVAVDLAIIHSISLPPGVYGGDAIERLFTNRLDAAAHPAFADLAGLQVSAHFLIRRDGELLQFVDIEARAWHAGVSNWRGQPHCNDRSIGIELEGLEGRRFERGQYEVLSRLLRQIRVRWPVAEAVGHEHVAPGRKRDPGPGFDWPRLARGLQGARIAVPYA